MGSLKCLALIILILTAHSTHTVHADPISEFEDGLFHDRLEYSLSHFFNISEITFGDYSIVCANVSSTLFSYDINNDSISFYIDSDLSYSVFWMDNGSTFFPHLLYYIKSTTSPDYSGFVPSNNASMFADVSFNPSSNDISSIFFDEDCFELTFYAILRVKSVDYSVLYSIYYIPFQSVEL